MPEPSAGAAGAEMIIPGRFSAARMMEREEELFERSGIRWARER
jgi:hypothetical protein